MRDGERLSEEDLAVGRRMAELRHAAHLSQAEVARRLGFAQSRIAKLETGTRRLLFSEAMAIAALYEVPVSELVPSELVEPPGG